jgi:hypothetical protein
MSDNDLKTVKEIAGILRRDPSYVYALRQEMTRTGFVWTAGQSSMANVRAFFVSNPNFRKDKVKWGSTRE